MNHALDEELRCLGRRTPVDWRQRLYRVMNSQAFVALLFLLLPVALLAALKIYPVFYNLFLSFTRYELFEPPRFYGLKNYNYVFTNSTVRQSIFNTLLFTIEAVPIGTALALIIAKLLNQSIRGRVFLAYALLSSRSQFSRRLGDDLALDL